MGKPTPEIIANNLVSLADRTTEEKRTIAIMGGQASGEARAKKKLLQEALLALLQAKHTTPDGTEATGAEIMTARLFAQAANGDIRAFEVLRDTAGLKAAERVEIAPLNIEDEV